MSPADVHYGRAPAITAARGVVLDTAYDRHPERFVRHAPIPPRLADASWINRRADDPDCTEEMAH
jgi:putative transposase